MLNPLSLSRRMRYNFSHLKEVMSIPSLIEMQKKSYDEFLQKDVLPLQRENVGLQAALMSLFPVQDFSGRVQLEFDSYVLEEPKHDLAEARQKGLTYAAPLRAKLRLVGWEDANKTVKLMREQNVYLGDIPLMTEEGTFVINGVERVVVSQMHRSPGVFFDHDRGHYASGKYLFIARIIPAQGSWIDFEFDIKDQLCVRIDRKRKLPVTTLLMALDSDIQPDPQADPAKRAGMSRQEILNTFYQIVPYTYQEGKWAIPLQEAMWKDVRLDEDLIDAKTGSVLARQGEKLRLKGIRKMIQEGVSSVIAPASHIIGRYASQEITDAVTGEVYVEAGAELTQELVDLLIRKNIYSIETLDIDYVQTGPFLRHTLVSDKNGTRNEALFDIYRVLRPGEVPTVDGAFSLFHNLFFNPERYDLSDVGRLKINSRLDLDIPLSEHTLCKQDFIAIVKYLLDLKQGRGYVDDIDSLTNRRVRPVGELLETQYRSGLSRMQRNIKERMVTVDLNEAMPNDLLNARPLSSIIREFFGTSQLSQFMDQTNPLSEISHKRRISALGPGGLMRDRASIEVRDVHPTHYGRICPIETPEGANIGLINSMTVYARINQYGFLETPYRKVQKGCLTEEIVYISAMEEEKLTIAQADVKVDASGKMLEDLVGCRRKGDFVMVAPEEVDFADVSPKQIVSVAAALIPFVENDAANRALMGSNMQRQAVPLMRSRAPLIGTGIESLVVRDSGVILCARREGTVDQVDANHIVIRPTEFDLESDSVVDIYHLSKFRKSNAGTCIHQKPLVKVGQKIQKGEVIADGAATDRGELALGHNSLVAFMSWNGYCFEDSIVLSQRLVDEDAYTSIHIEELETSSRDMKLGYEEITRDIPGASEEGIRHLDEAGIAYIGAEVCPGDILVGKVSPKAETPLTPEEKLLRAIFSDKAADMKDTSLRVPAGMYGTVVGCHVFYRRGVEKDERTMAIEREMTATLSQERDVERRILEQGFQRALKEILLGQKLDQKVGSFAPGTVISEEVFDQLPHIRLKKLALEDKKTTETVVHLLHQHDRAVDNLQKKFEQKLEKLHRGDDLPTGVLKTVKVFIAVKRKIQPGDKMAGRHGNKGVVSIIVPQEDMPYLEDGTPVDIILNSLGLPSRMNVGQILETHLGWAALQLGHKARNLLKEAVRAPDGESVLRRGLKDLYDRPNLHKILDAMSPSELLDLASETSQGLPMASPVFEGAKVEEIDALFKKVGVHPSGQEILYDGRTGEPFDRRVTVGVSYMMKLHHLVDEKIHARSIGPYSLVTQQPLGGKSQFGGQRFGEMEVWTVQAYGAAFILREMLTVKSDDLQGRMEVYKAIIKGQENFGSDVPESFNVLVKELKTLALNIECRQEAPLDTSKEEPLKENSDS